MGPYGTFLADLPIVLTRVPPPALTSLYENMTIYYGPLPIVHDYCSKVCSDQGIDTSTGTSQELVWSDDTGPQGGCQDS
jgi:hypothetical protein